MQVPNRAGTYKPIATARGAMSITCPACQAAPAWRCANITVDADGNPYIRERLKHPHPERKQAWRDIREARRQK
jgi:hypothetical protein